jgi:hypothetical protein
MALAVQSPVQTGPLQSLSTCPCRPGLQPCAPVPPHHKVLIAGRRGLGRVALAAVAPPPARRGVSVAAATVTRAAAGLASSPSAAYRAMKTNPHHA